MQQIQCRGQRTIIVGNAPLAGAGPRRGRRQEHPPPPNTHAQHYIHIFPPHECKRAPPLRIIGCSLTQTRLTGTKCDDALSAPLPPFAIFRFSFAHSFVRMTLSLHHFQPRVLLGSAHARCTPPPPPPSYALPSLDALGAESNQNNNAVGPAYCPSLETLWGWHPYGTPCTQDYSHRLTQYPPAHR